MTAEMDALDYYQIPIDFYDQPEVLAFLSSTSPEALHFIIRVLLAIGRTKGAELLERHACALGAPFGIDREKASLYLDAALLEGIIQRGATEKTVTKKEISDDQKGLRRKRDGYRDRKQKSRGGHEHVTRDSSVTLNTEQLNTEDLKDLDLKKETVWFAVPIPEPGLTAPWRDCPLVLLSAANIEDTQMRAKSQGLDPDLHGPDLPNAAIRAQRHLEEHPRDKRIFSALVGFGFTEALKTKHAREGPRSSKSEKSNFDRGMDERERLIELEQAGKL